MAARPAREGPCPRPADEVRVREGWRRNIESPQHEGEPPLGRRQLRTLRPPVIREWYAAVAESVGHDQAAKSYRLLRAVLQTAATDDLIRDNPCRVRGGGQENAAERPMVDTALVLALAEA